MYEFPLSLSQKKLINEWTTKKNKPLFITGNSGSGKTTFANQLLNDYHIIHINSEHLKYSGDLIDYIKDCSNEFSNEKEEEQISRIEDNIDKINNIGKA